MKADWIEIKRGDVLTQSVGLHVSLNPRGEMALNRFTFQRLGEPEAFVLLYDRVNNRIGLQPARLSTRNAYPAAPSGKSGKRIVRVVRLMKEHRVVLTETIDFPTTEIDEDGILVLDLRTATISKRALGFKKRIRRAGDK